MAEEYARAIVFIDEIDAIGMKRYDSNSGGEREIQRAMLELLNQLDGFDSRGDVTVKMILLLLFVQRRDVLLRQVIMATNRTDSLDPALIRPGRIDRNIEFPLPDEKARRMIFKIHTGRLTLSDLSGADIKVEDEDFQHPQDLVHYSLQAICSESGLMALRERRMKTFERVKKQFSIGRTKAR